MIIYRHGKRDRKEIALTFDDAPSEKTISILNVLKKHKIKATFFIWGKKIKGREKLIKQMAKEGHEIGNHSENHLRWPCLMFKSKKTILNEILTTDNQLKKLGIKTDLFRPPKALIGFNLYNICRKLGKKIILYDIDSRDWLRPKKEYVIKRVLKKTRNGSIIVFHDYIEGIGENRAILEVLGAVIPELKKRGFKLVTLSKILTK